MDLHAELLCELDRLSENLADGTDLTAILRVLSDDLRLAVPGFIGLDVRLTRAGIPLMLSTMTAAAAGRVRASLMLTLGATGITHATDCSLIYYAERKGAFADLAADIRSVDHRTDHVHVDAHLEAAAGPTAAVVGFDDLEAVNQALGILIAREALTLEHARVELQRRADRSSRTPPAVAQGIINRLTSTTATRR